MLRIITLVIAMFLVMPAFAVSKVDVGDKVKVKYIGRLKDGRVFDHNIGRKDLIFTIGSGSMIKAFEDAFIGMKKGDMKTFMIPAKNAYGEFDVNKLFRVPIDQMPSNTKVGDVLRYNLGGGAYPVRVVEVEEEEAYIDANHKLAGKDLSFEIELIDFKSPNS